MVGRSFKMPIRKETTVGESLLALENVSVSTPERVVFWIEQVSHLNFPKEVVGLAGISGNGQRILGDIINGMQSPPHR
ncbi:MAG: hypothetical protein CM1200mP30_16200 [Pseudomonadota bacterium]|nr:MAG: hypothetical protein CM1200mP30_16200 [Pseudomonadota bacterium]